MPSPSWLAIATTALLLSGGAALAQGADTLTGPADAAGPDIVSIQGQKVMLLGIDAPEANQTCDDNGKTWTCADTAFAVLNQTLKSGGDVTCHLQGTPDPFGKRGALCTVGGQDVGDALIKQGLALAYPHDPESKNYTADEKAAKAAKQGLWADGIQFAKPWEFRARHNHTPYK